MKHCPVSAQEREHAHRNGLLDERDAHIASCVEQLMQNGSCSPDGDTALDTRDLCDSLPEHDDYLEAIQSAAKGEYTLLEYVLTQVAHDLVEQEVAMP